MLYISCKDVVFTDGSNEVLKGINLDIEQGECVSIVGHSGSGKSTFLKLLSGLISPTSGEIFVGGQSIDDYKPSLYRRKVSYCFQQPYLFGRTVRDNVEFPFQIHGKQVDWKRVHELLDLFQMPHSYIDKLNVDLSGGEKQRLCLIRSLINDPDVILLDEVTSALDVNNTLIVESVLQHMHKEQDKTILAITHNEEQSRRYVNRRITIEAGRIVNEEVL